MGTETKEELVCPRCGKSYKGHPALSRADNKTPICPECGQREALEAMGLSKDEIESIIKGQENIPEWEM